MEGCLINISEQSLLRLGSEVKIPSDELSTKVPWK